MSWLVSTIPRVVGTEMGEQVYDPVVAGGRESELGSVECLVKVCCGTVKERGLLCCCQSIQWIMVFSLMVRCAVLTPSSALPFD